MSLILEALRKSEAERRRGRAPDLYAELPPAPARRHRMLPPWFWIAIAAALLLAVALFWLRGEDASEDTMAEQSASATSDAGVNADSRMADTTPSSPFPSIDRIAAPPAPAIESTPAPATPAMPVPQVDNAIAPAPQARETREPLAVPMPPAPTPGSPASPSSAPAPAPATPTGPIAKLSELSPEERTQLPPMKLTMHMWNERPAQRFVILDGNRYTEGDRIGSATLTAIDTEGAILDLNGRAVRVPLR